MLHYQAEIDLSDAIRLYAEGEGLIYLSKVFGIGPRRLRRALILAGVPIRSNSESLRHTYERMTPAQRTAIAAHGHNARRGKTSSIDTMERRAKTAEASLQLASRADLMLYAWLIGKGVRAVPQKAVGIYNIDIAIHEPAIAVEVDGRWHHFRGDVSTAQKRREYLFNQGWGIINVQLTTGTPYRSWKYLRPACADKIVSMLDGMRGDVSVAGKYWMIGGDGETLPGSSLDGYDRPVIAGPVADIGVGGIDNRPTN